MSHHDFALLIDFLCADPACSLERCSGGVGVPGFLPEDVRTFFSAVSGGGLFYDADHPTPQFGCLLNGGFTQPISEMIPCDGGVFDQCFEIAVLDTGEYDYVVVSTAEESFGQVYSLHYSAGDPALTEDDLEFLAPSLTRWLEIHVEAWGTYLQDWREGNQHFADLIEHECALHSGDAC